MFFVYLLIGIVVCVVGYALIDQFLIDSQKKSSQKRQEQMIRQAEKRKEDNKKAAIDRIEVLSQKYSSSPLTSLLLSEIQKITNNNGGKCIHRITYNRSWSEQIDIYGGNQETMYSDDLELLGKIRIRDLGYELPSKALLTHEGALLKALCDKMGSDYEMHYWSDEDTADTEVGSCIERKTLMLKKTYKSPI